MSRLVREVTSVLMLTLSCMTSAATQDSSITAVGIAGGMGITAIRVSDLVDYINFTASPPNRLDDFSSAAEFFAAVAFRWSDDWGAKVEYAYLINSYNVVGGVETFEYSYIVHMPMLVFQYLEIQRGYAFKFGGGVGYHGAVLSERLLGATPREVTSRGLGLKAEIEGNTVLGDRFFVYMSGDMRMSFMGAFKDAQGNVLTIRDGTSRAVTMHFFALGLTFGMMYYF